MLEQAEFDLLIRTILDNDAFPLIPHHPSPDIELLNIFNKMQTINKMMFYNHIFKHITNIDDIEKILRIYTHYNGKIDIMVIDEKLYFLNLEVYFMEHIFQAMIQKYNNIIIPKVTNNEIILSDSITNNLYNSCLNNNIDLYINLLAVKNKGDINAIWNRNKFKVFDFINKHSQKYKILKELNQPAFIIENMNNRLDICEDTIKYLFEYTQLNPSNVIDLKKNLGFEMIIKYNINKFDAMFFINLIESIYELKVFLKYKKNDLYILNDIINILQQKFPHTIKIIEQIILEDLT